MNDNEEIQVKPVVRSRGRMMDFAPRGAAHNGSHSSGRDGLSEAEQRRREIARREIARREEIHRQIEEQKEQDIIAKRRAIAARKDLARRLEAERKENTEVLAARERELELERARVEKARRRALIEARALQERNRILAEQRARRARAELEARRQAENKMRRVPIREIENPRGSKDPLARKIQPVEVEEAPVVKEEPKKVSLFKRNKVEKRLGSVEDFEAELNVLETKVETYDKTEEINAFVEDKKDDYLDDIDQIEREAEEEKASRNNARYVLGGRSPFINTEVEKRPLSGGNKTYESTSAAAGPAQSTRLSRHLTKPTKAPKGRYVPYEEPIPHKNIYARTVAKEKETREIPTMVVGDTTKGSKVSLIIAIILTVILGATVGAIAYLALFQ